MNLEQNEVVFVCKNLFYKQFSLLYLTFNLTV